MSAWIAAMSGSDLVDVRDAIISLCSATSFSARAAKTSSAPLRAPGTGKRHWVRDFWRVKDGDSMTDRPASCWIAARAREQPFLTLECVGPDAIPRSPSSLVQTSKKASRPASRRAHPARQTMPHCEWLREVPATGLGLRNIRRSCCSRPRQELKPVLQHPRKRAISTWCEPNRSGAQRAAHLVQEGWVCFNFLPDALQGRQNMLQRPPQKEQTGGDVLFDLSVFALLCNPQHGARGPSRSDSLQPSSELKLTNVQFQCKVRTEWCRGRLHRNAMRVQEKIDRLYCARRFSM